MRAGRRPPIAPDAFGERMRARVASGELTFTANADMEFVIGQYEAGFVAAINRVAAERNEGTRSLYFVNLGWGDAEAAELRLALQYAAAKCAFPEGAVGVQVTWGNPISEEALATLPPRYTRGDFAAKALATLPPPHGGDCMAESVDWGAPGDARHAWKGKFYLFYRPPPFLKLNRVV